MKRSLLGFTLTEILVVISIVSLLASIVIVSTRGISAEGRDTQRQADLREVQLALEQYKNKYGEYPQGCNGANAWSGEVGSGEECPSNNPQYIIGLAPEFIPALPTDPRQNSAVDSGYMYFSDGTGINGGGNAYKFIAYRTVEVDEDLKHVPSNWGDPNLVNEYFDIVYGHEFKACDRTYDNNRIFGGGMPVQNYTQSCDPVNGAPDTNKVTYGCDVGLCDRNYNTQVYAGSQDTIPSYCRGGIGNTIFETSYAVWGGIVPGADNILQIYGSDSERYRVSTENNTENVYCVMP